MPRTPRLSILLAVHNDAPYVRAAVRSLLVQTYTDFELLIIDDASTDGTAIIVRGFADPRIRLTRNPFNLGLTRSLNLALDTARGQLIARMDADDIALPTRLAAQVAFLDAHPNVGLLGTARTLIDESGAVVGQAVPPTTDLAIRFKLLLGNPFAHPTVMLRRSVLTEHQLRYDESFRTAQDYELWPRLLAHTQGANLPEPLLQYRLRNGISHTSKSDQLANHDRIAHRAIQTLLPDHPITPDEVRNLRARFGGHSVRDPNLDPNDPTWTARYAALRQAFIAHHAHHPEIATFSAK